MKDEMLKIINEMLNTKDCDEGVSKLSELKQKAIEKGEVDEFKNIFVKDEDVVSLLNKEVGDFNLTHELFIAIERREKLKENERIGYDTVRISKTFSAKRRKK